MKIGSVCAGARSTLADMLCVLASGAAFWFIISCDHYKLGFTLCSLLGLTIRDYEALLMAAQLASINKFGEFKILSKKWHDFIKSGHLFSWEKNHLDMKKTKPEAHIEVRKVKEAKKVLSIFSKLANQVEYRDESF